MIHKVIFTQEDFLDMLEAEFESPCGIVITKSVKSIEVEFEVRK